MSFHVGQKVVCVNGSFSDCWRYIANKPIEKAVYTVRALTICTFGRHKDMPCLLLEEVRNPVQRWDSGEVMEIPFVQIRFRPIVERKTDISCLKALLVPGAKILEGVE